MNIVRWFKVEEEPNVFTLNAMLIIEICASGEVVLNVQVVRSLLLRPFRTHLISITEKKIVPVDNYLS